MSKFYLKKEVTVPMLEKLGFDLVKNSWGYRWAVRKPFTGNEVTIVLHNYGDDYLRVLGYRIKKDIRNDIKDLIDLGYVVEE